jgi:23S rRNA pseudouridine2457 synthase
MRYFLIYKPYGMLSQFTPETPGQRTLADLGAGFPGDVYPVGRLDADSEGLLLLTDDPRINARLLDPAHGHPRTYWAQVERVPTDDALERLRRGVEIRVAGRLYRTLPAAVRRLEAEPALPPREPPVRFRQTVPTAWIELVLREGKNHQVRKMCAAAGFPVLRLVRARIGALGLGPAGLGAMASGEVRELDQEEVRLVGLVR